MGGDREGTQARHEDTGADGHGLAAGPDAQGKAEGVGAPTARGGTVVILRRAAQAIARLVRMHGGRVQGGKSRGA